MIIVMDTETGEILGQAGKEFTIKRKIRNKRGSRKIRSRSMFVKLHIKNIIRGRYMEGLGISEYKVLVYMMGYLRHTDNSVTYLNGKKVRVEKMMEDMGISRTRMYSSLKRLKENDIIIRGEDDVIYINPAVVSNGRDILRSSMEMFSMANSKRLWGEGWDVYKPLQFDRDDDDKFGI